jgi:hypothetical protein
MCLYILTIFLDISDSLIYFTFSPPQKKSKLKSIQDDSRVIMSQTELKMKPTIHLEGKARYYLVYVQLYVPNVLWVAF